jgi:hypothetical protein
MAAAINDISSHGAKRGLARDHDIPIWYLIACFILDPTVPSGLRWRERPLDHFWGERLCNSWNARWAGKPVGALHPRGYWHVELKVDDRRRFLKAHRIVYALTKGYWPPDEVDHENRERGINQIENLREATHGQNGQNTNLRADSTSGFKGVSWHRKERKWRAHINRTIHLGLHIDILDAIRARQNAEIELHTHRVHPKLDTDIIALPLDLPAEDIETWKREFDRGLWELPPRIHWQA